jgi:hypothetical protein
MKRYEEILSKIAPIFFKFVTYNEDFLTMTEPFTTYLSQAGFYSDISVSFPISINYIKNYINYLYYCRYILMKYKPRTFYPYILLSKISLYKKSNVFLSIPDVLTNMIINNFSFEKLNFLEDSKLANKSLKDLFIAAVGKDTYDTIRANIK